MEIKKSQTKWKTIVLIAGTILLIWIVVYFMHHNYFKDPKALQKIVERLGPMGPVAFILFQAVQVLVPILPGGISGSLAMLCFGTWLGFFYSYVGVIIGSCLAFWLVRKYGKKLLVKLVDPKTFDKYYTMLQKSKNFTKYFAILIFMPVAPDDLLCMIAGLSKIKFKTFLIIILLGKPVSSFLYSYVIVKGLSLL